MMVEVDVKPALIVAARHALAWLIVGNGVGLWLAVLLIWPGLQTGEWSYGRWVPVHLNVQLYGWSSLPLIVWLFAMFEVDAGPARGWARAVVWAWSAALGIGVFDWLAGGSSGKIFLDWKGSALLAFLFAQMLLWWVLGVSWRAKFGAWSRIKRWGLGLSLLALAFVPVSMGFACSPQVYPPVDRTTGGPTGASLLGSTLVVIGMMVVLPRLLGVLRKQKPAVGLWVFYGFSWVFFMVSEYRGGTHFDAVQLAAMVLLLPWAWWIWRDWTAFDWPQHSKSWRVAMLGWWGLLVVSGFLMYLPGTLDRVKFTQALVGHSHLAMAGFTSSFCAVLLEVQLKRRLGGWRSVVLWNGAALVMVIALVIGGWLEGANASWMLEMPWWRTLVFGVRAFCGVLLLGVSVNWWLQWRNL